MELIQRFVTKNPCWTNNVNAKSLYDRGVDRRYWIFQQQGPQGGMLHSVACAQPSAMVFITGWDSPEHDQSCVHAFVDANDGKIYQCLRWNYRGWHGGGSSNDTHIGVEMCESKWIRYLLPGEAGYSPGRFQILDKAKAQADCKRTYNSAVELFAMLAAMYKWNVDTDICSHKEGYFRGIASNHGDPEHYWKGLEMPYTMNTFRAAVKKKMKENEMTRDECNALITQAVAPLNAQIAALKNRLTEKENELQQLQTGIGFHSEQISSLCELAGTQSTEILQCTALTEAQRTALEALNDGIDERIQTALNVVLGPLIGHLEDAPKWMRPALKELLEFGVINGGTPAEVDPQDVNKRQAILEAVLMAKKWVECCAETLLPPTRHEEGEATEAALLPAN